MLYMTGGMHCLNPKPDGFAPHSHTSTLRFHLSDAAVAVAIEI